MQLVGARVQLRRAGRAFKGLCPFHGEKTPSFTVDPDRRTFRCFGCGEHGDVFDWVMKTEGLQKSEALVVLAERAGVELAVRPRQETEHAKRLLAAQETALFYFRQALRGTPGGAQAAGYLAQRGIAQAAIDRFALGYAPARRDGLLAYLRKRGFSDDEAVGAGLAVRTERGLFDRFHDRLMVPIRDPKGRTIAFGGRALAAHQPAKYVNSPQTALFNKSATLYALDLARPAIRRESAAVIVEGYFDAIACHQAGLENVVASMGTALTESQYRVLDAMGLERAVVAFDADAAGAHSAERRGRDLLGIVRRTRSGDLSTRTGLGVYVAELTSGDPDDLARTDPDALRALVARARPVLDVVIDRMAARHDLAAPDGRRRFLAEAVPVLRDEPDALTRELYLGRLSVLTGVSQEALREEAAKTPASQVRGIGTPAARVVGSGAGTASEAGGPAGGRGSGSEHALTGSPQEGASAPQRGSAIERFLMAQLVQYPEAAAHVDLLPEDLSDPLNRAVLEELRAGRRPDAGLPAHLAAAVAALGAHGSEPAAGAEAAHAIEAVARRLREQNLRRRLDEARAAFARASGGDAGALDSEVARLGEELEALMRARERSTVLRAEMEID